MDSIRKHAVGIQTSSASAILGVLAVLREPSLLSLLNSRLAAVISLAFAFPFFFLSLGFNMASNAVRTDVAIPAMLVLPRYLTDFEARQILRETSDGMRRFLQAEAVSAIGLGVPAFLLLLLTLRSTSRSQRVKELGSNDLSRKMKVAWLRPVVTFFFVVLLIVVYFSSAAFLLISAVVFGSGCAYLVVLANTAVLTDIFFYLYMANIWISVMEDDFIGKEEKGKRLRGVALMAILVVSVINPAVLFIIKSGERETSIGSTVRIGILGFFYLVKLIGFAVYTTFYHEYKKAKEEQEEVGEKYDYTVITNNEV